MLVANRVVIKNLCYVEYQNATFKYMDILSGKIYRSREHPLYNTSGQIHKTLIKYMMNLVNCYLYIIENLVLGHIPIIIDKVNVVCLTQNFHAYGKLDTRICFGS